MVDSNFATGAAIWRSRRNVTSSLILLRWSHCVKKWRHPENRMNIACCIVVREWPSHGRS